MRSSRRVSSLTQRPSVADVERAGGVVGRAAAGVGGAACATTRKTMSVRPIVTVESGGSAASTTLRPFEERAVGGLHVAHHGALAVPQDLDVLAARAGSRRS